MSVCTDGRTTRLPSNQPTERLTVHCRISSIPDNGQFLDDQNCLEVTEVEPLMAYLHSISATDVVDADRLACLGEAAHNQIEIGGFVRVSTETAAFIAEGTISEVAPTVVGDTGVCTIPACIARARPAAYEGEMRRTGQAPL